ncbi:MAG: DUF3467 domain-containing protein [Candidatus Eisenbacteria bacterium]|nr:DUF3467 domain-containing protein [Candidatus Eisenbacteria bacterium]MCC7142041.1 DUF3467 domain-containing protein [Candidatus Eisenbacteria bacterium]
MENGSTPPLKLQIDASDADGIYSNLVVLAHSSSEFVLDFARVMPGTPNAKVHARIIMTPQHALGLLKTLEADIARYESQNGKIRGAGPGSNDPKPGIGFK